MDNLLQIMDNICKWQTNQKVHPLTCGNDSNHPPLFPVIREGQVVLFCAHCNYQQEHIPPMFGAAE